MELQYQNTSDQTLRFELNMKEYEVGPGKSVTLPEKYDYALELMGVQHLECKNTLRAERADKSDKKK